MPAQRIYLDHAATTPMRPEAIAAVEEGMRRWANPSSPHAEGRAARGAIEDARARIKAALGWEAELIFTSGATEAIQLALRGFDTTKVAISAVEHDAVRRAVPQARVVAVDAAGMIEDPGRAAIAAVQSVNNETGVMQPWNCLAALFREREMLGLCDCAQSAGKLALPDADMITLSAHKLGGPPGVGALLVRDFAILVPTGGQERGYRAGTENLPAILGLAAALEAGNGWMAEAQRLRARLEAAIRSAGAMVIGADSDRIATIGAYRMPGVPAAAQLIAFDLGGVAVSAGSACSSGSLKASHVLAATGMDDAAAGEVVRVSFGWSTTEAEVDRFIGLWLDLAQRRRAA